eukprot:CAMPEP_0194134452 /NCGR_PEP_ID=MMETSP0152-20130528/4523_1 /TAXON_ID=1049557 /ORGANISM="Thalassiothrix antarctica, Strain L6-D1" /LENGTH=421 /DNA_ID=CAMNT_0038830183 /DNA_START=98 /DNA_END=1363 /DNA_ORIENTATION=-
MIIPKVSLLVFSLSLLSGSSAFSIHNNNNNLSPITNAASTTTLHVATTTTTSDTPYKVERSSPGDRDLLVRAAKGEDVERTPVWLMRQAGRYMAAFRAYSTKYPFRERSETPSMAIELSTQCVKEYGMDGMIMFSDILTPLPVLGIDFDVIKGTGPVISTSIRTEDDVKALSDGEGYYDFDKKLPFIRDILKQLKVEADEANTSLIGFIGAPFTLASYTIEGKSSKACLETKKLIMAAEEGDNAAMTMFMDLLADMMGQYACHQIDCGAEVIQIFESWAHQLSPRLFEKIAKPAAQKVIQTIKRRHPDVPVIYFANGGSSYLELQRDMGCDSICIDWSVDMAEARKILGKDIAVSGNLDPTILFGSKEQIEHAVRENIDKAGGPGKHLLNLGHGVMQGTPEIAVKWLVDECKRYGTVPQQK